MNYFCLSTCNKDENIKLFKKCDFVTIPRINVLGLFGTIIS